MSIASFPSMLRLLLISCCMCLFFSGTILGQSVKSNVHVPEYLVESRINKLDLFSPVPLDYNQHVQAYVDVYTQKRPDHLSRILGRSRMYFPLFEEYLDKYNLPMELKYLAVIESALDPTAKSSSGAYGLWQFLYQASRMFDLEVTSYIDERADPVKATDAACRYLQYLYANFNDWLLAIAAYNGGIGAVKEAIVKSGGERDYWKLRPYLSEQVRGYVPAFVAVTYAMNHYGSYDIKSGVSDFSYDELHTTRINGGISFQQIQELTGITVEELRQLNPSYKMDYIPLGSESVRIVLPENRIEIFHQKQPFFRTEEQPPVPNINTLGDTTNRKKQTHIVAPGEFFHQIAMKYECRIEDLMYWNKMEDKSLYVGQSLVVWKPVSPDSSRVPVPEIEETLNFRIFNADAGSKKSNL